MIEIKAQEGPLAGIEGDVVLVLAFEGEVSSTVDQAVAGWATELFTSGEFTGKPCELSILHRPAGLKAKRLAIAGAGKRDRFNAIEMRKAVATAVRTLKCKALKRICLWIEQPEFAQSAVEGAILGDFEPDQLKTDPKKVEKRLTSFTVCAANGGSVLSSAAERGRIVGEAQNFARELENEPANHLTPLVLADRAKTMAAEFGLDCEVMDEAQLRELGMGALLGVSQGSDNPPAFILLRYVPADSTSADHLALIGKGVTFDTGGVSIKPADGMEKMKYDMGGAAAVLGAMRAIAQLKPNVRITAFVPTVENMVSGRAQRPGDIVTSLAGKTVEVLNTDAEGRLILIDAITYALRQGCTHLVDAATLTGAIVVALGHVHVGAFTNNDEFLGRVMAAGKSVGESMWHMPLDDEYKEYLRSAFADLPNIGGRWGGAITAAKFLQDFVEDKPWVHLDIAGTAWLDEPKPYLAKGPTGVPVRTFVNLALNWN
ncbi:MAG TPA: leucyl aminopeptidase [Bryobacteraceae bacterium]|nr:leucyl aminopeptidase [Bryobacteraceae bacterium]